MIKGGPVRERNSKARNQRFSPADGRGHEST